MSNTSNQEVQEGYYINALAFDGKLGRVSDDCQSWQMDHSIDGISLPGEEIEIPDSFKSVLHPMSEITAGTKCVFKIVRAGPYWIGVLIAGYDKPPGEHRKLFCVACGNVTDGL